MSTICVSPYLPGSQPITNPDQAIVDKAWTLARNLQTWSDERAPLLALRASKGSLTTRELAKLRNLNAAIGSYEACMADMGDLPVQDWITQANKLCSK